MKQKTILILSTSGGGGLLQAAKAKEQEIKQSDPDKKVIVIDIMYQWLGTVGRWGSGQWNNAQRKGNVGSQIILGKLQIFADIIFWPTMFIMALVTFIKEDMDKVINTQPVCISAVIKALRLAHLLKKKKIMLEQVIVDLPTKRSTHFFRGVKILSKKDKQYVRIISMKPFLEDVKTTEEFWRKYCDLPESQVKYEDYYIRQGFHQYIGKKREDKPLEIFIRSKDDSESAYIEETVNRGKPNYIKSSSGCIFTINPQDRLYIVLLGTQPAYNSTCSYVKRFMDIVRNFSIKDKLYHLFIFCAEFSESKKSLFQRVIDVVRNEKDYPSNLNIIPMSFQDSNSIAALFHRSDVSITRSGGQTMMELMGVATGETWVHSETKLPKNANSLTYDQLFKGLPSWEAGNAGYLCKEYGGKFVTPEILEGMLKPHL